MPVNKDPFKSDVKPYKTDETVVEDTVVERNVAPTTATKSEKPVQEVPEDVVPQSYVWLANGSVVLANDEDLPGSAGHGSQHGFWQIGNKVHTVVGVYPIEATVEES